MANLIIVCGPQAVGKMTVAESIRDKIKYNLTFLLLGVTIKEY